MSNNHDTGFIDVGGLVVPESYAEKAQADDLLEVSGDWRLEFDSPFNRTSFAEQLGIHNRFTLLREWQFQERRAELERSHTAWERNPLANSIISYTTQFVVGKGINITYKSKEVEAVLEQFMDDPENDFYASEREFCDALQIDGELFIRFFDKDDDGQPTGITKMIALEPWNIQYVRTDPQFRKRIIAYRYIATLWDGYATTAVINEEIPAEDIQHVSINRLPYEVRGRPELTRILPWLKAYKDWLEERARLNRRKSIYYHMQLKNSTPGQVSATRSAYREPPPPGSFLVTNDNVDLKPVAQDIRAGDAAEDGRSIKLMALAGARLPEYFFAEGSTANRASTTSQQFPALRKFMDFKERLEDLWGHIFKRVLRNAVDAGILPEMVPQINSGEDPVIDDATGMQKYISVYDAFDASYPDLEEADPLQEAQAAQLDLTMGLVSLETVATRRGYDYNIEQKKIDAEHAKTMAQAYAGTGMPVVAQTGAPTTATAGTPSSVVSGEPIGVGTQTSAPQQVNAGDVMRQSLEVQSAE